MHKTRDEIMAGRRRLRSEYGKLYDSMAELLFRHDPIGINFENNTDEYEPEVGTILPRLKSCRSVNNVLDIVYEEFVRWFDPSTAGAKEGYREIASEIWQLWRSSGLSSPE